MGTTTVFPAAASSSGGALVGGTALAVLSDGSDGTYWWGGTNLGGPGSGSVTGSSFTSPTIPAAAQIKSVKIGIRASYRTSFGIPAPTVTITSGGVAQTFPIPPEDVTPGVRDIPLGTFTQDNSGAAWTAAKVAAVSMVVSAPGAPTATVTQMYCLVTYDEVPVISALAFDVKNQAFVTYTYTDPEGDAQEAYQLKIFTNAVKTGGGFSPDTSPATYDSGVVYSPYPAGGKIQTSAILATQDTWWAYLKVSDVGSGLRWTAWSNVSVTNSIVDLAPGLQSLVYDDAVAGAAIVNFSNLSNLMPVNEVNQEAAGALNNLTGGTMVQSTDHAVDGTHSAKITTNGTLPWGCQWYLTQTENLWGDSLTLTFDVSIWPVSANRAAQIVVPVGISTFSGPIVNLTAGQWNTLTYTVTVPFDPAQGTPNTVNAYVAFGQQGFNPLTLGTVPNGDVLYTDHQADMGGSGTAWALPEGALSDKRMAIQRSDDGGVTWVTPRLYRAEGGAVGVLFDGTFFDANARNIRVRDYEAPRAKVVQYRARIWEATPTATGSPWSSAASVSPSASNTWLKDPTAPTLNWRTYTKSPGVQATRHEPQTVYNPIGATRPVVLYDTIIGDVLTGTFIALDATARAAWIALHKNQRTLLLQLADGRQWYVHFGPDIITTHMPGAGGGAGADGASVGFEIAWTATEVATP